MKVLWPHFRADAIEFPALQFGLIPDVPEQLMNTLYEKPQLSVFVSIGTLMLMTSVFAVPQIVLAQNYTLDDWMTISTVDAFEWSPDGRYIYYTSNAAPSGTFDVFRIAVNGGEPEQLGRDEPGVRPERKEQLTLAPDGRTIYFAAARYYSAFLNIYRMPAGGGPAEALTFNDAVIQSSPAISADNKTLAFFARTGSGAKVFTLDLTGKNAWPKQMFPGDEEEFFPAWSAKGDLAFSRKGDIWVKLKNETQPGPVIDAALGGRNSNHVWSPEGDRIAFTNSRSGFSEVGIVDVKTGAVTSITNSPAEHGQVAWSADGHWLAYLKSDDAGMSNHVIVSAADGSGTQRVITSGKGKRFSPGFSPDGKHVAFIESNSTRTRDVWQFELSGGRRTQITHSMGAIDPASLTEAREIFYRAEDNLEIPGMLWLPPDFDSAEKYPVIVRLHGHPGQWNHDFRMMTQYFVNKGFVAIAPNPRGSVGFGQGFHDLHIADYGGAEFLDVMGVIPFMESLGYIDMRRKATWGGSGGGYMSMTIATKAPDVFQAQVIRAPVTNWKILVNDRNDAKGRAWTATRTPQRSRADLGGSYQEIPEEYEQRSPVNFVESVQVPQLLLHGLRDTNVLPRQSIIWYARMQELGKGSLIEFVKYPDEDHSLRRYKSTIRDRIERMTGFFSVHLDLPAPQ